MARATVAALKGLRRPEEVARARGKRISEILPPRAAVEQAPVEEAPVEQAPVEEAPATEAPAEEAPAAEAPVEEPAAPEEEPDR
jgi:hypothetical protein